jgi:hypothetical protein
LRMARDRMSYCRHAVAGRPVVQLRFAVHTVRLRVAHDLPPRQHRAIGMFADGEQGDSQH